MFFVSFSELQTKKRNEIENVFLKTKGMQNYVHPGLLRLFYITCKYTHYKRLKIMSSL